MVKKLEEAVSVNESSSEFLLEYYLLMDRDKNYGVKIEKKENSNGDFVLKENYTSEYTIEDEETANEVLELLAKNIVTPTTAEDVLEDLGYFD